ncbi:hypothetical protein [Luteimonas mephitis]|uniref:hypothetical protein n=1 Tax=Luteimonas mephitis TaxID=83615 RepID=UPI00041EB309|nr:hypothetical protein [Luteimonas mephitis]
MVRWNLADPEQLREQLPEIGRRLQAQLEHLHRYPNADAAEALSRNLDGARQHALQLADALRRGPGDGS